MLGFEQQVSKPIYALVNVEDLLGEGDATTEWERNSVPKECFIHIRSYDYFKDYGKLYLFGRRGTGKTSILRMLKYEFEKENNGRARYSYVSLIEQNEAYDKIANSLRKIDRNEIPRAEMVRMISQEWKCILNVYAMFRVVEVEEKIKKGSLPKCVKYLKAWKLLDGRVDIPTMIDNAYNDVAKKIGGGVSEYMQIGMLINSLTKELFGPSYKEAMKELGSFLESNNRNCLIMVDSLDKYDIRDEITNGVVSGLMDASFNFFQNSKTNRIYAKVALPSEIYGWINIQNKGKIESRIVFIFWGFKDLVVMLAKRHYVKVKGGCPKNNEFQLLDGYEEACAYLYKFLPKEITSENFGPVGTLSYMIRHTQKKPRQVIAMFNTVLTEALGPKNSKDDMKIIDEKLVKDGVHARLDILVDDAIDVYSSLYRNADKIIKRVLTGAKSYFTYSDLDKYLQEVNALVEEERKENPDISGLTKEEVKSLLIECGVIGVIANDDITKERFVDVNFEYQKKGTLSFGTRNMFAVHPMFYQELEIMVDRSKFICPKPSEEEQNELIRSIEETGGR